MATRSVIAQFKSAEPLRWEGVYHHYDGYPTNLGRFIYQRIQEQGGDVGEFLQYALSHTSGWSDITCGRCYCHGGVKEPDMVFTGCDCHGDNPEPSCNPVFNEWVYILDPQSRTMSILASVPVGGVYRHRLMAVVPLDGPEPDWKGIQDSRKQALATERGGQKEV